MGDIMANISSAILTIIRQGKRLSWLAFMPVAIATAPLLALPPLHPALAETHTLRVLTVTGQGSESLPTTIAIISLAVEVNGLTAEAVQQDMAQRSADLVDFLQSQPIQNLETTGVRLSPRYDYRNDQQRLIGYSASNTVRFEVAVEESGELLDEAVQAGATRIDSVQFRATDAAITTAQRQALQEATLDAQDQADAVLTTLGLTRQDIVGIQVNHAQAPLPPSPQFAVRESLAAADTPIIASEQEITASVTLQIQY